MHEKETYEERIRCIENALPYDMKNEGLEKEW